MTAPNKHRVKAPKGQHACAAPGTFNNIEACISIIQVHKNSGPRICHEQINLLSIVYRTGFPKSSGTSNRFHDHATLGCGVASIEPFSPPGLIEGLIDLTSEMHVHTKNVAVSERVFSPTE